MFAKELVQFKTVQEFSQYLNGIQKPTWLKSLVLHHTWKPVESDWNGLSTMQSLKKYYEKLGWDSGPHLFLCIGSPNKENDGIWLMSNLHEVGIHANECNSSSWGLEIVGNYDVKPWSSELSEVVYDLIATVLRKIDCKSVTKSSLRGHRECNSPKTCPGKKIDMDVVRNTAQKMIFPQTDVVTRDTPIMSDSNCTIKQAVDYLLKGKGWYTKDELQDIIIKSYFDEGKLIGVNPCLAIAQMVHETGFFTSWWSNRPRRNPAGIGVTGQTTQNKPSDEDAVNWAWNTTTGMWHKGLSFANFDKEAVPAHMSRLLAYATTKVQRTKLQQDYIDTYTAKRPLPDKVHGCAPTLAGLEGTWAYPGKGYADKIAYHANGIIRL